MSELSDADIDYAIYLLPGSLHDQIFRRDVYRAGLAAGIARERERCARVAETYEKGVIRTAEGSGIVGAVKRGIAAAIRADSTP